MFNAYTYEFIDESTGNVVESLVSRGLLADTYIEDIIKRLESKKNFKSKIVCRKVPLS